MTAGRIVVGVDLSESSRAALEAFVKETIDDGPATLQVVQGPPANVILALARDAALVVVGSRGHGELVGTLIGSVSRHVVTHASCPVVVVPRPAAG